MKLNILVTGVGGDIGQSVCKILKHSRLSKNIIGTDIHDEHYGKILCDKFKIVPKCNVENYYDVIHQILKEYSIDLLIPISEPELRLFTDDSIEDSLFTIPILMANIKSRVIGFDKQKTVLFLKNHELPYPLTQRLGDDNEINYPSIVKDKYGSGGHKVSVINDSDDYLYYKKKYPEYLIQEYLSNENEEYTCGLYSNGKDDIRSIVLKRKLHGGYSGYGEVVKNSLIEELLIKIASGLNLEGSINIQLRMTKRGPITFEINPRFSSTVMFRHMLGFSDLVWSIHDKYSISNSEYRPAKTGCKFYKGYIEHIEK